MTKKLPPGSILVTPVGDMGQLGNWILAPDATVPQTQSPAGSVTVKRAPKPKKAKATPKKTTAGKAEKPTEDPVVATAEEGDEGDEAEAEEQPVVDTVADVTTDETSVAGGKRKKTVKGPLKTKAKKAAGGTPKKKAAKAGPKKKSKKAATPTPGTLYMAGEDGRLFAVKA